MIYFIYFLVLIILVLIIYRLQKNKKNDLEAITKLETDIKSSLSINKIQQERVQISSEMNQKLQDARMIIDKKMIDLQIDLIEKVIDK